MAAVSEIFAFDLTWRTKLSEKSLVLAVVSALFMKRADANVIQK
jgi:hypothetical protein